MMCDSSSRHDVISELIEMFLPPLSLTSKLTHRNLSIQESGSRVEPLRLTRVIKSLDSEFYKFTTSTPTQPDDSSPSKVHEETLTSIVKSCNDYPKDIDPMEVFWIFRRLYTDDIEQAAIATVFELNVVLKKGGKWPLHQLYALLKCGVDAFEIKRTVEEHKWQMNMWPKNHDPDRYKEKDFLTIIRCSLDDIPDESLSLYIHWAEKKAILSKMHGTFGVLRAWSRKKEAGALAHEYLSKQLRKIHDYSRETADFRYTDINIVYYLSLLVCILYDFQLYQFLPYVLDILERVRPGRLRETLLKTYNTYYVDEWLKYNVLHGRAHL